MLHRLRSVLVRPGRDRLSGTVQVDETFIGGDEPGLRGGRAKGKKVLTGIAVEVSEPKGIGRCRMAVLADGSAESLHPFVAGAVEPGATVITDAWMGYHGLAGLGYVHERRSQRAARARGDDPGELLPAVHRVASLAKRWLLGTHQGSVDQAHLPAYLDEFVFRFNRRRAASRGMVFYRLLELAAGHDPVRFQDLLASKKPHAQRPQPPQVRGHPPSLDRSRANWPWRTGELQLQLPIPLRLNEYPNRQNRMRRRGRWGSPGGGAGLREVDARYLRGTWQVDHDHRLGRQVAVVLAWPVTRCAICLRCAGIGCRRMVPGPYRYGVIAGEWFVRLASAHVRPGWMRLGAQSSACWFAQVRRFCGRCPWLSVRWAAWMPVCTDI